MNLTGEWVSPTEGAREKKPWMCACFTGKSGAALLDFLKKKIQKKQTQQFFGKQKVWSNPIPKLGLGVISKSSCQMIKTFKIGLKKVESNAPKIFKILQLPLPFRTTTISHFKLHHHTSKKGIM